MKALSNPTKSNIVFLLNKLGFYVGPNRSVPPTLFGKKNKMVASWKIEKSKK